MIVEHNEHSFEVQIVLDKEERSSYEHNSFRRLNGKLEEHWLDPMPETDSDGNVDYKPFLQGTVSGVKVHVDAADFLWVMCGESPSENLLQNPSDAKNYFNWLSDEQKQAWRPYVLRTREIARKNLVNPITVIDRNAFMQEDDGADAIQIADYLNLVLDPWDDDADAQWQEFLPPADEQMNDEELDDWLQHKTPVPKLDDEEIDRLMS